MPASSPSRPSPRWGSSGISPITWVFNSEEEIGSPVSRTLFAAEAKRSAMAFVLEPGGSRGEVTTGRKGRLGMKIFARGVAGHAAQVVEGKKSAILDLARVIVELEGLNGTYPGVSVSVGLMAGGITPNSVPDAAWATIDVRSTNTEGFAFFRSRLDELLERRKREGMELAVETVTEVPVMEATEANKTLFAIVAREARKARHPRGGSSSAPGPRTRTSSRRREPPWWTGSDRSGGTATATGNILSGRASFSGAHSSPCRSSPHGGGTRREPSSKCPSPPTEDRNSR